jgi:tRNA threonylcarbamoyladenosine biosynthesis protein TsaE
LEYVSKSVEDTMDLGKRLGNLLNAGDIICLKGDLGTGKTYFTKGIASGLKINTTITSPTFTIVNEYEGRLKLFHFDVYRVNDIDEISSIGFDEYIFSSAVSVIEWADYIKELIPEECIWVSIYKMPEKGLDFRKIIIKYHGNRYNYIKELK